ncbi:nuclear body protein SP140-like [Gadus chalcogrammus]|uniref:nuclear body protein SP140-like n=1 Tax=Gadus chalcogrammus TaxID=1042646 RepID=UPI0024C3062E|nr:nuclear body protein SP140-like [Gadus chalcogrammus]
MNPLDTLDDRQLRGFFRRSKTEMSCMDKPKLFLKQLRDHKLILEEKFQEMIRIKRKEVMQDNVYELLNWIETERPRKIRLFWICVFKEFIMTQCPTLKRLQDSLRSLPNGENAEIWTLDKYRHHLPVTCGDEQGTLYRDKLAKGEPCILRSKKWYTPCAFQKLGGKLSRRNWKTSIRCKDTTLEKLLKDRHLTCPGYNKSKAKKSTLPCSSNTVSAISESEEEMEEEEGEEEELQANPDEEVSMEDEVELQGNDCSTQNSDTGSFPLSDEESSGEHAREGLSEDKSMGKERGGRDKLGSFCDRDEQQGHSSSQASPRKRKPTFGSLPKGENVEIWTLDKYRHQLPVTCGDEQGTLYRDKLAKGEPCILRNNEWYTPRAFQKLSGKGSRSNWKKSIRCNDTTLEKLLKNGHLTCPGYNKCKAKKSTLPCSSNTVSAVSESEEEMEEEEGEEEELQANPGEEEVSMEDEVELQGNDCSTQRSDTDQGDNLEEVTDERPRVGQNEFRVICGALSGMLHKSRFASGRCGKSIRTEDRWMSPVEFVAQGSAMPDALWRRDIQWEGQPLSSSLIERKILHLHSEQCDCSLCHPDPQALKEQKSDEYCFVCGRWGDLVMCDHCPRSFHQKCHLPQLDPSILGNEYLPRTTYEETLMIPVSNQMLPCHYLLLSLYHADKDHIFAKDPCIDVRGYSSQIVTPMWLDKITEQLLDQQYTIGMLLTDIQLIFSNCDQFNQNKPEFRDMGIKLKEFYEQFVEKVFRRQ